MQYDFLDLMTGTGYSDERLLGIEDLANRARKKTKRFKSVCWELEAEMKRLNNPELKKLKELYNELHHHAHTAMHSQKEMTKELRDRLVSVLENDDSNKLDCATTLTKDEIDTVHRLRKLKALSNL